MFSHDPKIVITFNQCISAALLNLLYNQACIIVPHEQSYSIQALVFQTIGKDPTVDLDMSFF